MADKSYNDSNYYEKAQMNLKNSVGGETMSGIKQSKQERSEIANNKNLSTATKNEALALNAAEMGMQALGALGAIDEGIEAVLLPALGALGMSGIACLPISKQLDPVMGIDIHIVNLPPPVPVPMPHPYIGMLMRPKDFAAVAIASIIPPPPPPPDTSDMGDEQAQKAQNKQKKAEMVNMVASMAVGMLGATVKIGSFQPRAVAGTPTINIPHFPMGAGFHPATMAAIDKNNGHAFMGSLFALADEDPISGGGAHLHLSCNDIGIPSIHDVRPSKNTKKDVDPRINLYLPTSLIVPIPSPRQILTNPVPIPMNPISALKQLFKASLGRFFKKKKKTKDAETTAIDSINDRVSQKNKRHFDYMKRKAKYNDKSERLMTVKEFKDFRKRMKKIGVTVVLDNKGKVLKNDAQAGYDPTTKTMYLKKPPKTYDAMHESFHAKQHNEIGDKMYKEQSSYQKEKYVHEQLMKNKSLLTDKQINHADAYLYKVENGHWPPFDTKNGIYIL